MTSPESLDSAAALEEAKEELARRMEEACETGISRGVPETTGELLKLEDALHAATKATGEVIAARQRAQGAADADEAAAHGQHATEEEVPIEHSRERIREFRASDGEEWRVWAVTPGMASPTSQRYLGELRDGWLAFESLRGTARRRLVAYPPDWTDFSDRDLEKLLHEAAVAPIRKRPEAGA
jgi:hypothetical protein